MINLLIWWMKIPNFTMIDFCNLSKFLCYK